MKKHYIITIFLAISFTAISQTGPGGVGNSSNLETWLDASKIVAVDNDPISTWNDQSGNANNANQGSASFHPIFKTNQVNGMPSVRFDGINDRFDFSSTITSTAVTTFAVYSITGGDLNVMLMLDRHVLCSQKDAGLAIYLAPQKRNSVIHNNNSFSAMMMSTGSDPLSGAIQLKDRNILNTTRTALWNNSSSTLGCRKLGVNYGLFFEGDISEVIVYDEELTEAQKNIVNNYLSVKYGYTTSPRVYSFNTVHKFEVFGVGQESDGAHTTAKGSGIVEISNPSSLNNGDYLLIGHDNGSLTSTSSVGKAFANNRYTRIWRSDVTNSPGTVDLKFELAGNNFAADPTNSYRLLIDNVSGAFDNSGITQALTGTYNAVDETITFTGVSLTDGDFFTLGERTDVITAVASTDWNNSSTWDCICIPTSINDVVIPSPFTVSINGADATTGSLTIDAGGSLSFSTDNALSLSNNFLIDGSISMPVGKFTFDGVDAQEIWNTSGSTISFYDLEFNNVNNVSLKLGDYEVTNFVTVTAGQLVNDGGRFTFVSDATNHSQIKASAANAFSGNYITQRHFTSRAAGYADITVPVVSTTIGDWDQELFMSGVGGADGDVQTSVGGPVENTVWKYDNAAQSWIAVTDTNTTIDAGEPIELFLGDNLTTFSDQTMDSKGTPFSGSKSFNLFTGFNFIGNPYRSFINYTTVTKPAGVSNQFYIYTQNTGAYVLYTGGFIASEQGFWVSAPGARTITINESNKLPLNFNQILRQKRDPRFELKITNLENNYGNHISLVATSKEADNAAYLKSPEKKAPAIVISNENKKLIQQSLNTTEQSIQLSLDFYAGLDGSYELSTKDFYQLAGDYSCIVLEDKVENKMMELSESAVYSFNSFKGEYERFNLHLLKSGADCESLLRTKSIEASSSEGLQLVQRGNTIELNFQLEKGVQAELDVFNLNGQKMIPTRKLSIEGQGTELIFNNDQLKGIYLFVIRTNKKVITEKFRLN